MIVIKAIKSMTQAELSKHLKKNHQLILDEQSKLLTQIDFDAVSLIIPYLKEAKHIFVTGAGRSGLAMKSAAMRLMHFGFTVYVVGETTSPAIEEGDLLITASGSGTTSSVVTASEKAKKIGAKVVSYSTTTSSPLAQNSDLVVVIPAAQKQDHGKTISAQYAGSLFEQAILILSDAVFQTLWDEKGTPAEELWKRHANLE